MGLGSGLLLLQGLLQSAVPLQQLLGTKQLALMGPQGSHHSSLGGQLRAPGWGCRGQLTGGGAPSTITAACACLRGGVASPDDTFLDVKEARQSSHRPQLSVLRPQPHCRRHLRGTTPISAH